MSCQGSSKSLWEKIPGWALDFDKITPSSKRCADASESFQHTYTICGNPHAETLEDGRYCQSVLNGVIAFSGMVFRHTNHDFLQQKFAEPKAQWLIKKIPVESKGLGFQEMTGKPFAI
jgi:hypothetical protein